MKLFKRVSLNSADCDTVEFKNKKGEKVSLTFVPVSETHSAVALTGKKYAFIRDEAADTKEA